MEYAKLKNYNSEDNTRKCKKCENWLDLSNFSIRVCKSKDKIQYRECCKECSLKTISKSKYCEPSHRRKVYEKRFIGRMFRSARDRATNKGWEFNIIKEDIIVPLICPLLNIPLIVSEGNASENSPSLDRIDNSKGYIKGNIWVISYKANTVKNNLSIEQLEKLVNNLKKVLYKSDEFGENP